MRTKNTTAQVSARAFQRPLGRTLQLRRTLDKIGMSERMAGVEAPFYRERGGFVCKISGDGSAVRMEWRHPEAPAFSPAGRGISRGPAAKARFVDIAPALRQVVPIWIHRLVKFYLLAPPPALDFFFACDRGIGIEEALIVYETSQVVAAGKTWYQFALVLPEAAAEIARHPRVEDGRARAIVHYVEEEFVGESPLFPFCPAWLYIPL